MLNAAEIAKQADAMLAEREQEMKELEQQKRRARDIMFKKTQQLKVRPVNPDPSTKHRPSSKIPNGIDPFFYAALVSRVLTRVIHGPKDRVTPSDFKVHTFRVHVRLPTY